MSQSPRDGLIGWLSRHWDAIGSALLAFLFLILAFARGDTVDPALPYLFSGIAGGLAVSGAAVGGWRWVSDRMKDSDYGELLRVIDKKETNFSKPYITIAIAGLVTSFYSLVAALIEGAISDTFRALLVTGLVLLASYCLLGSLSLLSLTRKHVARISSVRALREKNERDQRTRRWK